MFELNQIYNYHTWNHERFLIIPNWVGTDKEFYHIIECIPKEYINEYVIYKERMLTGRDNNHNLNTLEDAEKFILNYVERNKEG